MQIIRCRVLDVGDCELDPKPTVASHIYEKAVAVPNKIYLNNIANWRIQ